MYQPTYTNFFLDLCAVKSGLSEAGTHLTTNQTLSLILIKEFMCAEGKISVTKTEAYNAVIQECLGFSRSTFNRYFNALVRKRCLVPVGVRDKNGWLGVGEQYRLTMVSKRIDATLKCSRAAAA